MEAEALRLGMEQAQINLEANGVMDLPPVPLVAVKLEPGLCEHEVEASALPPDFWMCIKTEPMDFDEMPRSPEDPVAMGSRLGGSAADWMQTSAAVERGPVPVTSLPGRWLAAVCISTADRAAAEAHLPQSAGRLNSCSTAVKEEAVDPVLEFADRDKVSSSTGGESERHSTSEESEGFMLWCRPRRQAGLGQKHRCGQCLARFHSWSELEQHTADVHSGSRALHCTDCGSTFRKSWTLERHVRLFHSKGRSLQCQDCGQGFLDRYALQLHAREQCTARPFQCADCGARRKTKQGLLSHIQSHNSEKLHTCTKCGRSFADLRTLQSHELTHTGEKPYICTMCGRGFAQNTTLRSHERTHTGARPFVCPCCGKAFNQQTHLRRHQAAVHQKQRRFTCNNCGKCFSQNSHLRRHAMIHSGLKPYFCDFCSWSGRESGDLRKHKQTHRWLNLSSD